MDLVSINHLSNQVRGFYTLKSHKNFFTCSFLQDFKRIFAYLSTSDLQLVSHRWFNICSTFFPKKYHLRLENVTLSSLSAPVNLLKASKKVVESLSLSNVELDFTDAGDFSEVMLFLKQLHNSVTQLHLEYSIKPNMDLIQGFHKVQKLMISSPGWYVEIANGKMSFPEVRILRLSEFNIEIFGKNMFCSFFKKFSYVEQIEIKGDVIENYSYFGTYFGKKLKQIHFHIEDEQLAVRTMEFLTIIKGIELHHLTFVITNVFDVGILDRLSASHPSLKVIEVISKRGILPNPHPMIQSCEIRLKDEFIGVFKKLELFPGLKHVDVHFPWKLNHVQINCFFGHEYIEASCDVTTLKLSGYNKDCLTCFINMTATYPNLKVFEYISAARIELDVVKTIGSGLPDLEQLTLVYKNYDKSSKTGFAKYFEEWQRMSKLTKIKLEPISWEWSTAGLINLCNSCPLLEILHLDGGVDIDDSFLKPIMTHLRHLQYLTVGDTVSRALDIPSLDFLFPSELTPDFSDCQAIPMVDNYQQPCPRLKELRLLTCTLDMSLKLRLFQNFKVLRTVQDRKTLLTSKQFHEMRGQFQQDVFAKEKKQKDQGRKIKRFIQSCFC